MLTALIKRQHSICHTSTQAPQNNQALAKALWEKVFSHGLVQVAFVVNYPPRRG